MLIYPFGDFAWKQVGRHTNQLFIGCDFILIALEENKTKTSWCLRII